MVVALAAVVLACLPDVGLPAAAQADAADGAKALRRQASPEERARIAELLARQDQCILAHLCESAKQDFAEEFRSDDFRCDSGEDLLARWDGFLHDHRDVTLQSVLLRAERIGSHLVADVRRPFTGIRIADDAPVAEESVETLVFRDAGERLEITSCYENDASSAHRIDAEARRWDGGPALRYSLALPEDFVAIPRYGVGAALDQLLLVAPQHDATMGVLVFDPTLELPLPELMQGDFFDADAEWITEPRRWKRAPDAFAAACEAEIHYPPAAGAKRPGRDSYERAIYLSPDGRIVFAFWLNATHRSFLALRRRLDEFVQGLELVDAGSTTPYFEQLLAANPRWRAIEAGVYRPAGQPIELEIPPGMIATALLGDHVLRLRLRLEEDPGTFVLVRLFPPGEGRIAADRILERTVQRMESFACAEGAGGDSRRSDGTRDVLGRHGDWRGVEISCQDGTRRHHQIVAVDRDDCHVQVQILPASGRLDVQNDALSRVLEGLRARD